MPWTEKDVATGASGSVGNERASLLDKVKNSTLPVIQKEAESNKPFTQIHFQPVRASKTFEGEFALNKDDLVFHFWPWGYHEADKAGNATPRFRKDFELILRRVMGDVFGARRAELQFYLDLGSWYVRIPAAGLDQFHRDLSIKACENLHHALGGES